jgi:hypothetical protein
MPDEDLVSLDTDADECVALDLAPRADHRVSLDLDKRTDMRVVVDAAGVQFVNDETTTLPPK